MYRNQRADLQRIRSGSQRTGSTAVVDSCMGRIATHSGTCSDTRVLRILLAASRSLPRLSFSGIFFGGIALMALVSPYMIIHKALPILYVAVFTPSTLKVGFFLTTNNWNSFLCAMALDISESPGGGLCRSWYHSSVLTLISFWSHTLILARQILQRLKRIATTSNQLKIPRLSWYEQQDSRLFL